MTEDDLKKGKTILDLIKTTEEAVAQLTEWLSISHDKFYSQVEYHQASSPYRVDPNYWLSISEHSDGLGKKLNLNRVFGNRLVLEAVLAELKEQLAQFKNDFAEI